MSESISTKKLEDHGGRKGGINNNASPVSIETKKLSIWQLVKGSAIVAMGIGSAFFLKVIIAPPQRSGPISDTLYDKHGIKLSEGGAIALVTLVASGLALAIMLVARKKAPRKAWFSILSLILGLVLFGLLELLAILIVTA